VQMKALERNIDKHEDGRQRQCKKNKVRPNAKCDLENLVPTPCCTCERQVNLHCITFDCIHAALYLGSYLSIPHPKGVEAMEKMKQLENMKQLDHRDASMGSKSKRGDKFVLPLCTCSQEGDLDKCGKVRRHRENKKDFALLCSLSTSPPQSPPSLTILPMQKSILSQGLPDKSSKANSDGI